MKNATCKMLVKLTPGRLLQEVQQRVQRVRTVDGFKSIRYVLFQMLFYIFCQNIVVTFQNLFK